MTRIKQLYPYERDETAEDIKALARDLRADFPGLNSEQRVSMACIQLQPGRNNDAVFVGIDAKGRPVHEYTDYGERRRVAKTKAGDPTDVTEPVDESQRRFLKPSELVARLDSHGIYMASILDRCRFDTSSVTEFTEDETEQTMENRGLGGELDRTGEKVIWGWRVAEDLCYAFTGESPGANYHGRGFAYRACLDALREAGH